jgi:hypothetical protein
MSYLGGYNRYSPASRAAEADLEAYQQNYAQDLPSGLVTEYNQLNNRGCKIVDPQDVQRVTASPIGQELMASDQLTLVHSTMPGAARIIARTGLDAGMIHQKSLDLRRTTTQLYPSRKPTDRDAYDKWNAYALAYRFTTASSKNDFDFKAGTALGDGRPTLSRTAKVIMQFPFPAGPIPKIGEKPAVGTPLETIAKGRRYLTKQGDVARIAPQFVRGHLDVDTGEFTENPNFDLKARVGWGVGGLLRRYF